MLFRRPETHPTRYFSRREPQLQTNSNLDESEHLAVLGLRPGATWSEIVDAHASLTADLTPSPGAEHSRVALARQLLSEVNAAFKALGSALQQPQQAAEDTVA